MIRYKQCGSAGEISPSKVHVAPRGSPVQWDKELLILVNSAHSCRVEQLQDHPNAGGFACALQAGKPKCCAHVCREYQYWRHTQVQNIHFPFHLLHLKVISPCHQARKASEMPQWTFLYIWGHKGTQRSENCMQQRFLFFLAMNFSSSPSWLPPFTHYLETAKRFVVLIKFNHGSLAN